MLIRDHDHLEELQADGAISVGDADEVRRFAEFLTDTAGSRGPGRGARIRAALWKHYPELNPEETPNV